MIHVALRIAVWVVILGGAYLLFGPELFDSSRGENPFETAEAIYLPPAKSAQEREYERLAEAGQLSPADQQAYLALVKERQAQFWQRSGTTVADSLTGVETGRLPYLVQRLEERGLSADEIRVFLGVVQRDQPGLLADRE